MKKIFTNDKFFLALTIITIIGSLIYVIETLLYRTDYIIAAFIGVIDAACALTLFISYKKHSKNVMKGMMGALLMAGFIDSLLWISNYERPIDWVFSIAYVLLTCFLFVNHFIINSTHKSSKANVLLNQIVVILDALVLLAWEIVWIPLCVDTYDIIAQVAASIISVTIAFIVVCVESRLDAYRIERESIGTGEDK